MQTATHPPTDILKERAPDVQKPTTVTAPGSQLELLTGQPVIDLLSSPNFQKSWDRLFEACPWATVFQSHSFINAWYQLYRQQHLPILVMATEDGQLKGALPMVLLNTTDALRGGKGGRITGAGHYDALYQSWLAAPSYAPVFMKQALTKLMKAFPKSPVSFRFIPPETPLNWIKNDAAWRHRSILQSYVRPLINLTDPETEKLSRKSHFRNKLNRLKRLGEVQFECIQDLKTFESSLHEMAIMYDFRQSALFNKNHFRDDPSKKQFLLELFKLNLLHVTVLKVNDHIVAAIVAVTGKNGWIHLAGINCHSPFRARFYSPGYLHFILLSGQLAAAGNRFFDLTPGYDSYKEELANRHDEVTELIISGSVKFRLKRNLRKWFHARLIASGIRPMTAELNIKRFFYLVKRRRIQAVLGRPVKKQQAKTKQTRYHIPSYQCSNLLLQKDSLTHLLQFEAGKKSGITRWEFLADAMRRFETGHHCYTWAENDRLLACAWFSYPEATDGAAHTMELHHIYIHHSATDRAKQFVQAVIGTAVNQENKTYFLADDALACEELVLAGSVMSA
jgi:Protein involved in cellulose biosynthesis (CelD)